MPLRSFGCYLCRKRKIRCDETRPHCRRCMTHGVVCPGYRTERSGELEFRDQTSRLRQHAHVVDLVPHTTAAHDLTIAPRPLAAAVQDYSDGLVPSRNHFPPPRRLAHPHEPHHDHAGATHDAPLPWQMLSASSPWHDLPSAAAERMQFRNASFRLEVPQHFLPQERFLEMHHFQYARIVLTMPSTQPALVHALDALSMLQRGSGERDARLMRRGVETYGRALQCLSHVLLRPESLGDDSVLAAVAVLSKCEFFAEVKQNGKGWISHQDGMQRLIDARGPKLMRSRLAILLYFFSRGGAMSRSFMLRKRDFYASSPRWRLFGLDPPVDNYARAYLLGMRITELFERHDALEWEHPRVGDACDALLAEYTSLQQDMAQHIGEMRARVLLDDPDLTAPLEPCPILRPIAHFPSFASLVADRTLARAFDFPSYMMAFIHSQFWIRRFLLIADQDRLIATRLAHDPHWSPPVSPTAIDHALRTDILNLCRCVPYLIDPANSMAGGICCLLPMYLAGRFFHTRRYHRWSRWVQNVQDAVFQYGLALPKFSTEESVDGASPGDDACSFDGEMPYEDEFVPLGKMEGWDEEEEEFVG